MKSFRAGSSANTRAVIVVTGFLFAVGGFFFAETASEKAYSQTRRQAKARTSSVRPVRYSEFPHDAASHKIECSTCHKFPSENWKTVRPEADAFPDITEYPKHESCVGCHKQQFFKGSPPQICTICHTSPGPRNSSRHPFPNPREVFDLSSKGKKAVSDFAVSFPHDKHIDIVSLLSSMRRGFARVSFERKPTYVAEESCAVCHQTYKPQGKSPDEYLTPPPAKLGDAFWIKKGTFKTTPIGHTTCFTCHSADSGFSPEPKDCGICHTLKPTQPKADLDETIFKAMKIDDKRVIDLWRRRDSSGKYQHEFVAHVDMSCSTCHTVATMKTADPTTKRVSISSCAACHVTATADDGGTLNIEVNARKANSAFQCVKCHITFGKMPVPESHLAAIAAAGK